MQQVTIKGIFDPIYDRNVSLGRDILALALKNVKAIASTQAKVQTKANFKIKAKVKTKVQAEVVRAERAAAKAKARKGYDVARAALCYLLGGGKIFKDTLEAARLFLRGGVEALGLNGMPSNDAGVYYASSLNAVQMVLAEKIGLLSRPGKALSSAANYDQYRDLLEKVIHDAFPKNGLQLDEVQMKREWFKNLTGTADLDSAIGDFLDDARRAVMSLDWVGLDNGGLAVRVSGRLITVLKPQVNSLRRKSESKVSKAGSSIKFDQTNNRDGSQLIGELVVLPTGVKSETKAEGYVTESNSDTTFGVITKVNSSWNSSLFPLCEAFGIQIDPIKDVIKITSKDLTEGNKSRANEGLLALGYLPVTEGVYLREEIWEKVMGVFAKVFGELKDIRSYGRSFISTPALTAFKEYQNIPVFLAGDDLLGWEGNDGAGLVTAGTIMDKGFQFRYIGNGRFGKGLIARSHYLVKELEGKYSLVSYKDDLKPSEFNKIQEWLSDLACSTGYSIESENGGTYHKALILTPSTLKGINKKIPKGGEFFQGDVNRLTTIIGKDADKQKTSNNWQIAQLLQALSNPSQDKGFLQLKDHFFKALDKKVGKAIEKGLNLRDKGGNMDLIQLATFFSSEKYAHLLNTFNTKAESRYVNMMTFGGDGVYGNGVILKAFSNAHKDKLVLNSVLTRTPNQDSQSVQLQDKINPAKLREVLDRLKLNGWNRSTLKTSEEIEVINKVLGNWSAEECDRFLEFFKNVISPQIKDGLIWVSSNLQGMITGDNDGDRDIITDDPLWIAMGELIALNTDERPVKESLKAFVLKAKVIHGDGNEVELMVGMMDDESRKPELLKCLNYLTAKNSGQLNVGAITNGAAIATTYFDPIFDEDGTFRMKEWVRRYFFTCFDIQQVSIDRQKYAYVIPSLRYFHLNKGFYLLDNGNALIIPGLSFVPAGMHKLKQVQGGLKDETEAIEFFKKEFGNFEDGIEHMPDLELGAKQVQITDPVQGFSVIGVYTWAQFVLMSFKLCEALGVDEMKWGEVYEKLLTSQDFVGFFNADGRDKAGLATNLITLLDDLVEVNDPAKSLLELTLISKKDMLGWLDDANAINRPAHMQLIKDKIDGIVLSALDDCNIKAPDVKDLEAAFHTAIGSQYESLSFITNYEGHQIDPQAHMRVFSDALAKAKEVMAREAEGTAQSVRKQSSADSSTKVLSKVASAFGEAWYLGGERVSEEEKVMQSFSNSVSKALLNSQVNTASRKDYLDRFEEAVQKTASHVVLNANKYDNVGEFIAFLAECMEAIGEARTNTDRLDFHGENLKVDLIAFFNKLNMHSDLKTQINALYNQVFKKGVEALWDGMGDKEKAVQILGLKPGTNPSFDQKLYLVKFSASYQFFENSLAVINRLYKAISFYPSDSSLKDKMKATVLRSIKSFDRNANQWVDELVVAPVADFQLPLEFWAEKLMVLLNSGININLRLKKAKRIKTLDNGYDFFKSDDWVMYSSVMLKYLSALGIDVNQYLRTDLEIGFGHVWGLADYLTLLLGEADTKGKLVGHADAADEAAIQDIFKSKGLNLDEYRKALNVLKDSSFSLSGEWNQKMKNGGETLVANEMYVAFPLMLVNSLVKKSRRDSKLDIMDYNYTTALRVSLHNALGVEMDNSSVGGNQVDFDRVLKALWPDRVQEVLEYSGFGRIAFSNYQPKEYIYGGYQVARSVGKVFGKVAQEKTAYQKLKESRPVGGYDRIEYQEEWTMQTLFEALAPEVLESNKNYNQDKKGLVSLLGVMLLQSDFITLTEIALGLNKFDGSESLVDPCYFSLYRKISNRDFRSLLALIKYGQQGNKTLSKWNLQVNPKLDIKGLLKAFN